MEVVVLAGGMGTRLRSVVTDIPKPMAPVRGRPFLEYLLDWLAGSGATKVVLSVGYKWEVIRDRFGFKFKNIEIAYLVEEVPLGTGGAVAAALPHLQNQTILVVNGDTFFPITLSDLLRIHAGGERGATIALKHMTDFDRYGVVSLEGERIQAFHEKGFRNGGLINGGIYALDREFLAARGLPKKFSLERDVLEKEAGGGRLFGAVFDAPFLDIGIPEDYARATDFL